MEEKICNKTLQQIRESYFKRKIDSLLNDIQSEKDWDVEELNKLESFLLLLKAEQLEKIKRFSSFLQGDEIKPPTVDELLPEPSEDQKKKIVEWLIKSEECSNKCRTIMQKLRKQVMEGQVIKRERWLDAACEIEVMLQMIDQDRVYKDQMYRRKLTAIMDTFKVSRAEAEERAKLTREYRDYKLATLFRTNIEEFVMLCKKYYSVNF